MPLDRVISSLLSYGCLPCGASIVAFGLGYLIFGIVCGWAAGAPAGWPAGRLRGQRGGRPAGQPAGRPASRPGGRYSVWSEREYARALARARGLAHLLSVTRWLFSIWRERKYLGPWARLIH